MTSFSLRQVKLRPGEQYRDELEVELPAFAFGGQRYVPAPDEVALALPDKILCRPECAGLCGECGKNLNEEPHTHEAEHGDPRWQALEALREKSSARLSGNEG